MKPKTSPAQAFLEFKEAAGKQVELVRFYNDPSAWQAVEIHFQDGTALNIALQSNLQMEAELVRCGGEEIKVIRRYRQF